MPGHVGLQFAVYFTLDCIRHSIGTYNFLVRQSSSWMMGLDGAMGVTLGEDSGPGR